MLVLAVYFLIIYVIEIMIFKPMTAEALACRPNRLAIRTSLHVTPIHVQSVRSLGSNSCLVLLKLSLTHHFSAVIISNDLLVL